MNIPKLAIEKAIEGGWKPKMVLEWYQWTDAVTGIESLPVTSIVLDPSFWQALGKALWWKDDVATREFEDWRNHAHRFYDLVLTSGDVGKFWEDILSNKS